MTSPDLSGKLAVITGASGLLGGNLAAELVAAGCRVRATRRATTRIDHLADLDLEWVPGDLGDPDALAAAFRGADVVFHCAAAIGVHVGVTPELVRTNVDGTRHVLAAVRAAGGPRLVHVSSVVAIGLSEDGEPCGERARWNFEDRGVLDGYAITKHQAEDLVHDAVAGGLDAVIVNPTYMLGPRDARPGSGKLIVDVVRRKVPGWTPGLNNFVDVRDVARGMIAAWQRGERGERYILGGHELSYRAVMETIARVAGVRRPRLPVPRPVARVVGWVGDRRARRGASPLVTSMTVYYAYTRSFRFTCARARRELGYDYGPLEDAVRDAIDWFRAHDILPAA
jgi:dihydroflavonol-4-reductase